MNDREPPARLGILADIHGNRWALEAVLDDAERRDIQEWINLGDCFYGPLDPAGTAKCLGRLGATTIRGNQDRVLFAPPAGANDHPTHRFVEEALSSQDIAWLASLPETTTIGDVYLCHGTPHSDEETLLEEIRPEGVSLRPGPLVARSLETVSASVVLCGHTHVPRLVHLPDGSLVVNPGSVGLPAYTDDAPYPHGMEAGSPHARYAVLERGPRGWSVEHIAVPYDWETAARQAARMDRPDWATWLRTGRATRDSPSR